jgi:hypothetical protein
LLDNPLLSYTNKFLYILNIILGIYIRVTILPLTNAISYTRIKVAKLKIGNYKFNLDKLLFIYYASVTKYRAILKRLARLLNATSTLSLNLSTLSKRYSIDNSTKLLNIINLTLILISITILVVEQAYK